MSPNCTPRHLRQSGFAAIAAIFVLVVLAALGAFMVTSSNTQQLTSALDVQGSRAYWAARAGLEWGLALAKTNGACPAATSSFTVNTGASRQGGRQRACEDWGKRQSREMREFQAWCEAWGAEVLRVLKPGGVILAFGGTRTFHRLTAGLEDAGFEIRDCLAYMYGTGFPKSLDISKAIDKSAGAKRAVLSTERVRDIRNGNGREQGEGINAAARSAPVYMERDITAPATPDAQTWDGWGTALKPAWEPVIVAMKPLDGTFAQNALKHGVAGVNVDGCRIGTETLPETVRGVTRMDTFKGADGNLTPERIGRWPANVVLDEDAARLLDEQTDDLTGCSTPKTTTHNSGMFGIGCPGVVYGGSGGASRFFYTAKVSPDERGSCSHPTMKPLDLMRWLLTLVTMPSGTRVLDPFAGSGSTLVAARQLGIEAVGIELSPEYAAMAERRIASVTPSMFAEGP